MSRDGGIEAMLPPVAQLALLGALHTAPLPTTPHFALRGPQLLCPQKRLQNPRMGSVPQQTPPQPLAVTRVIRRDLAGYGGMIALGLLPAVDWISLGGADAANVARLLYMFVLSLGLVYLGVRRQDLGLTAPISGDRAALAPLFAGVALGGLYALIKYTNIDPAMAYQLGACFVGAVATWEVLTPVLGLARAGALAPLPPEEEAAKDAESCEEEILSGGELPALCITVSLIGAYLAGPVSTGGALPLTAFAALNNYIGVSIALGALGTVALESFAAAATLLLGLFCYDAFFVFKSDVMITVATQIEAPAKFLFAAAREGANSGRYPFSVLGLGDVVIPGAFIALLREIDLDGLGDRPEPAEKQPSAYFPAGLAAYAAGLAATFGANYFTKAGQPALVYIVPALLLTAGVKAVARGELGELLGYKSARAAAAAAVAAAGNDRNGE